MRAKQPFGQGTAHIPLMNAERAEAEVHKLEVIRELQDSSALRFTFCCWCVLPFVRPSENVVNLLALERSALVDCFHDVLHVRAGAAEEAETR